MRTIRMIVGVGGDDFSWAPGQLVTLDDAEAAKWADGERAVYDDADDGGGQEDRHLAGAAATGAVAELQEQLAAALAERDALAAELAGARVPTDGDLDEQPGTGGPDDAGPQGGLIAGPDGSDQVPVLLVPGEQVVKAADIDEDPAEPGGGVVLHADAVEPPAGNASRDAWAAYVVDVLKVDEALIEGKSRNDLRDAYSPGGGTE